MKFVPGTKPILLFGKAAHSSFIVGSHTTKNMASGVFAP
jgi:hypothetical protein